MADITDEWADIARRVGAAYGHRGWTQEQVAYYQERIGRLRRDQVAAVTAAVDAHADVSHHPPMLPDLRQWLTPPARPWEEALAELDRVTREWAPSRAVPCDDHTGDWCDRCDGAGTAGFEPNPIPTFDDPALNRLVMAYGWDVLRRGDLAHPTMRAQLRDSYRTFQTRAADDEHRARHGLPTSDPLPAGGVVRALFAGRDD